MNEPVDGFLFVALRLRLGQLLLELLEPLIGNVFACALVAFEEDQAVMARIVLQLLFRLFQLRLDANQLLRQPIRCFLRGHPSRFQVFVNVVFRECVYDAGREPGIVRIETHGYEPAPADRLDGQPVLESSEGPLIHFRITGTARRVQRKSLFVRREESFL